ncbi:MAG: deoxyribonuclease IV [Coriobacteriia bacterium]|nr:deoxyribonuclease IV [Coriobacteriia bacterium]
MRIGAHVSLSKGYEEMLAYSAEVGCECVQVFAKSPRQWHGKAIDPRAAADFVRAREVVGIPLFTHTAYLINLATPDEILGEKSVAALADELERGALYGASGVVTHLGNDPLKEMGAAATRVAQRVVEAFGRSGLAGTVTLLLENTAGAGTGFGCCPEDLGAVFDALPAEIADSVGICIDTCHAHAYGTDLSTPAAWEAYLDAYDAACGPGRVRAIHANDCLFERGSKKDRHAWIGEGHLGTESFQAMVCVSRLDEVSVLTEMPGDVPEKDTVNIERLKVLRSGCA